MNIYIGNLSREINEQQLEDKFSEYGKVRSVKIVRDMFTQESKGMGFVEMPSNLEAETAIKELNVSELGGKRIIVNKARPERNKRKGGKRR